MVGNVILFPTGFGEKIPWTGTDHVHSTVGVTLEHFYKEKGPVRTWRRRCISSTFLSLGILLVPISDVKKKWVAWLPMLPFTLMTKDRIQTGTRFYRTFSLTLLLVLCIRAWRETLSSFFFKMKKIFVQLDELDELDKFTHAWIRIHIKFHTSAEDTLV